MPDREKVMDALERCSDRTRKRCNPTCPYHNRNFCETELASDALVLMKEQEDLGTELTNAMELIHKKNERIEKLLKEQNAKDNNVPNKRAAGERAEAGAEDPEDNQGNNGPLKRIDPADVMDGLRRLAGSGVLGEHWREILADAMTLLWLRYER